MKTEIFYFLPSNGDNPVAKFLDSLEKSQQAKVLRLFVLIKEYGLQSVLPHIKKLTGVPVWELRILGKDNIRFLYLTVKQEKILILHGFIKKSQKTDPREINIALKRREEWLKTLDG